MHKKVLNNNTVKTSEHQPNALPQNESSNQFLLTNTTDETKTTSNQTVQAYAIDSDQKDTNNEGFQADTVIMAEKVITTDNKDSEMPPKKLRKRRRQNFCIEHKIKEAERNNIELTIFKSPFLLYLIKEIGDLNNNQIVKTSQENSHSNIYEYYRRKLKDTQKPENIDSNFVFEKLMTDTKYFDTPKNLKKIVREMKIRHSIFLEVPTENKHTSKDLIKKNQYDCFADFNTIRNKIQDEINDIQKMNSDNIQIYGKESIDSEVNKILQGIDKSTCTILLNKKYKEAMKLICYNAKSDNVLYRLTSKLIFYMPEFFFI